MSDRHPSFEVPVTIDNGFEVVQHEGVEYLRVIAAGVAVLATPTHPEMLRAFAVALNGAADTIEGRS